MKRSNLISTLLIVLCASVTVSTSLAITITSDYSGPTNWGETAVLEFTIKNEVSRAGYIFLAAEISNIYAICDFGKFEYEGADLHVDYGSKNYEFNIQIQVEVPWWTEEGTHLTILHFTYTCHKTGWTKDYSFNGPTIQVKGYMMHIVGGAVVAVVIIAGAIYWMRKKAKAAPQPTGPMVPAGIVCSKCSTVLPTDAAFCEKCGTRVTRG